MTDPASREATVCTHRPGVWLGKCVDCGEPNEGREATVRCDGCSALAAWQLVTNGDHRDVYACGRHLHALLLAVTGDGWAKVGPMTPLARESS